MAEIVIIGAAILDVLTRPVSTSVFQTGSCPVEETCMSTGADALNEALILTKLGKKVSFETIVGDDEAGQYIVEKCRKNNIYIEKRQIRKDIPTGINIVLIDEKGERSFLTNPESTLRKLLVEDIRMPFDPEAKILCFASIFVFPQIGTAELARIFTQAKRQGMTVCADMTKRKKNETVKDMKEALSLIDFLFPNEEEACLLTGKDDIAEAAQCLQEAGVRHVIIKCGRRGCYVRTKEEAYFLPPEQKTECLDSTGAGDSFAAGFLFALSENRTIRECARFANACGALAVQKTGAVTWAEDTESIKKLKKEKFL